MRVRAIESAAEVRQVGRLRYERFVEERRCRLPYADHAERLLLEPLDETALLLGGYVGSELVGSARLHLGMPEEYRRLYRLAAPPDEHRRRLSVTSRLVVSRRAGSLGRAALRLSQGCFDAAAPRGAWLNFIDCNEPLREFFRALGFIELGGGPVRHEVFGEVHPMVVVLPAVEHFRRLRSPFHSPAAAGFRGADLEAALWLLRLLAPATELSQLLAAPGGRAGELHPFDSSPDLPSPAAPPVAPGLSAAEPAG